MLSEHQPSANEENEYIEEHGFEEYSKWYSGVDADENEDTKGRYKFPYHSLIGVYN
jgi:murein tripeptide amidase MpaA